MNRLEKQAARPSLDYSFLIFVNWLILLSPYTNLSPTFINPADQF